MMRCRRAAQLEEQMVRTVAVAVLLVAAVTAAACGGDDGGESNGGRGGSGSGGGTPMAGQGGSQGGAGFDAGSDPMRNDVAPGDICRRFAEITCAGEQFCCDAPGRAAAACISSVMGTCNSMLMADTIARSAAVGFNAAAAKTAFTELEERASNCDPSAAAWAVSEDGFPSSFAGTLGMGDDCEPTGGLQAPIDQLLIALTSCRIGDGLVCLPGAMGWVCAPHAAAGQRCFNDFNCNHGLYCDNPDGEYDGMCVAGMAAGSDCDTAAQCASYICSDGMCAAAGDAQAAYCGN
jgi:hypothetical protein